MHFKKHQYHRCYSTHGTQSLWFLHMFVFRSICWKTVCDMCVGYLIRYCFDFCSCKSFNFVVDVVFFVSNFESWCSWKGILEVELLGRWFIIHETYAGLLLHGNLAGLQWQWYFFYRIEYIVCFMGKDASLHQHYSVYLCTHMKRCNTIYRYCPILSYTHLTHTYEQYPDSNFRTCGIYNIFQHTQTYLTRGCHIFLNKKPPMNIPWPGQLVSTSAALCAWCWNMKAVCSNHSNILEG